MIHSFTNTNTFINIIQKIYKDKYNFDDKLSNFHSILNSNLLEKQEMKYNTEIQKLGINDRNSIFIKDYHNFVDNNTYLLNDVYFNFVKEHIKPLYPQETAIVIQKTPNLRISFPNVTAIGKTIYDINDVVGMHKDSDFGHHCDEVNYIIPITEMFDTNSLYYEPFTNSGCTTDQYINLKLTTNKYFVEKLSNIYHFNKINKTGVTRISLDFRIIPYEKYIKNIDYFQGTKFELGKYYTTI